MNVYSFLDHTLVLKNPLTGSFVAAGQVGMKQMTVTMATEKTAHNVAADGNIMVSAIPGDNGSLDLQVQQTSELHTYLQDTYNAVVTAMNSGVVISWAAMTGTIRGLNDGVVHTLTGVSFTKLPDKPYAAEGQDITWRLMAANIVNLVTG